MAITQISEKNFNGLSADDKSDIRIGGAKIFYTDTKIWQIKKDDGTWTDYNDPHTPVYSYGSSPSATITRPNNADPYIAGDVVGQDPAVNMTFSNILPLSGGRFAILSVRMRIDVNAIPAGMQGFRLHLYNATPTGIADNAAYNLPEADRAKYLGYVTLSVPLDNGDTLWCQDDGVNFIGKLATGSTTIYGILQTPFAFTPTALCVKAVFMEVTEV
jgi:hypothetical protein